MNHAEIAPSSTSEAERPRESALYVHKAPISVGGIEFVTWLRAIGRSRATGYRWMAQGWIKPDNIAGKLFLTQDEIDRFWARAKAGEFAKAASGVCVVRP